MSKRLITFAVLCSALLLASSAQAQYLPFSILSDGDLNPQTGGIVDNVAHPSLSPGGILAFDGDDEGTTLDDWIWVGAGIAIVSGDSVTINGVPSSAVVDNIDDFFEPGHVNDAGQVVWDGDLNGTGAGGADDTNNDEVLMLGLDVLMQEGTVYPTIDPVEDPGEWNSTCIDSAGTVYCEVDLDGATTTDEVLVRIAPGAAPQIVEMNLFSEFREGSTIVGGALDSLVWDSIAFTDTIWNANGDMITDGDLDEVNGVTTADDAVLVRKLNGVDYELLAREGDALILPSGSSALLTSFTDPRIADNGDWVCEADTDAATTEDNIVLASLGGAPGYTIIAQEGEDISAVTGITGTTMGLISGTNIISSGVILILADVNDDTINIPPYDEALFMWDAGTLSIVTTDEVPVANAAGTLVDLEGDNVTMNDAGQIVLEADNGTLDGIYELSIPAVLPVTNVACGQNTGSLTVDVSWDAAPGQSYDGFNIYLNGAFEATVAGTANVYSTGAQPVNSIVALEVEGFVGSDLASPVPCNTFVTLPRDYTLCSTPGSAIDSTLPPAVDVITFAPDVSIRDVTISINITHTFQADLDIDVSSPFGTNVVLTTDNGGGNDNISTTFADFGNPISGNLNDWLYTQPEGPGSMADFQCETSGGDWTLTVVDDAGGDVGTLDQWCVNIYEETNPVVIADICCPPPSDFVLASAGACATGGVLLEWTNNFAYGSLELVRDDGVSPVTIPLGPADSSYDDAGVVDGTTYTYTLQYTCTGGGTVLAGPSGTVVADSSFVPEVSNLVADVQVCNNLVELGWSTAGVAYDTLEVYRAGVFLADVTGLSTYTDTAPPAGTVSYSIVGSCGTASPSATTVSVDFTLQGPSGLTCTTDTLACDGIATLTWTNNDAYAQIDVLIDGLAASTQPQPTDTTLVTDTLSPGIHLVEVIGFCGGNASPAATCSLAIFVPPSGETDVILALEGRETTTAYDPGLVDSASALQAALAANGVSAYVTAPPTASDPDFTTQLPCGVDLGTFERIWVMTGTFPNDYRISAAEGDFLASLAAVSGAHIYFEGGDHWGFLHTASLLDERDGIEPDTGTNVVDGDDSFTQTLGLDSGNGVNATVDFPLPVDYAQDQTGTDFTDQFALTGTTAGVALDLEVASAGAIWVNSNDGIPNATDPDELLPYITAVFAASTLGGSMISHSFEFGGFGTAADRELLAGLYLEAFGYINDPGELFFRGDTNNDTTVNIADAIYLLGALFPGPGGQNVLQCDDAADTNDDGTINIADAIALLGSLFGSPAIPLPAPNVVGGCEVDPTDGDLLECPNFSGCP
jgi:subtilisin-like proprotein convertase family protein